MEPSETNGTNATNPRLFDGRSPPKSRVSSLVSRIKHGDKELNLFDNSSLFNEGASPPPASPTSDPKKVKQSQSSIERHDKDEKKDRGGIPPTIVMSAKEQQEYKKNALKNYKLQQFENTSILNSRNMERSSSFSATGAPVLNVPEVPLKSKLKHSISRRIRSNTLPTKSLQGVFENHPSRFKFPQHVEESLTEHVFSFLSFDDLVAVSQVCRKWNALLKQKVLWERIFNKMLKEYAGEFDNIWEDPNLPPPDSHVGVEGTKLTLNQIVVRLTPNANVPGKNQIVCIGGRINLF